MIDIPAQLNSEFYIEKLAFNPNSIPKNIYIQEMADDVAGNIFKYPNKNKEGTVYLILNNFTNKVLNKYKQFLIDINKTKLK